MNKQGIGIYDDAFNNLSDAAASAKDAASGVIDDSTIEKAVSAGGEKLASAGKNAKQMAEVLKDFAPKNEDEALSLAAKLAKAGGNE